MAVFVPEGSLIGQSAVGDGDVVVVVVGGKGTSMVVGHGVTCRDNRIEKLRCLKVFSHPGQSSPMLDLCVQLDLFRFP